MCGLWYQAAICTNKYAKCVQWKWNATRRHGVLLAVISCKCEHMKGSLHLLFVDDNCESPGPAAATQGGLKGHKLLALRATDPTEPRGEGRVAGGNWKWCPASLPVGPSVGPLRSTDYRSAGAWAEKYFLLTFIWTNFTLHVQHTP